MLRIGGLASGMDIENIVKDLMRAERVPLDKLFQKKVLTEWRQEEYRSINTKLLGLRDVAFNMRLQSSFTSKTAASANTAVVTATTTGNSQVGSFEIGVDKLATAAKLVSEKDGSGQGAAVRFNNFKENIVPEEGLVFQLRGAKDGDFQEITIKKTDSLENVLQKINAHKDLGINAYYDEFTEKIVFTSKNTGINAKIEFNQDDPDTDLFVQHVLIGDAGQWFTNETGANAEVTINGLATERESNTFVLNGTNITLHSANPGQTVRLDIKQDTEKAFDNIMSFVNKYNELIESLNGKYREPKFRDFLPLTNEQKEAMSDKEIEKWEEKAKSGLLKSDQMLSSVLSDMRLALSSPVAGLPSEMNSLFHIGITTGAWNENGKLYVNETKLKDALRDNPEQVMAIFANVSEVGEADEDKKSGVSRKLYNAINNGIERIAAKAGKAANLYDQSFLGNEIRRYNERMAIMEDRLKRTEDRYWRQFSAMEKALSEMYSQSDWLYQQISSLK